jgi:hypothetical protein
MNQKNKKNKLTIENPHENKYANPIIASIVLNSLFTSSILFIFLNFLFVSSSNFNERKRSIVILEGVKLNILKKVFQPKPHIFYIKSLNIQNIWTMLLKTLYHYNLPIVNAIKILLNKMKVRNQIPKKFVWNGK